MRSSNYYYMLGKFVGSGTTEDVELPSVMSDEQKIEFNRGIVDGMNESKKQGVLFAVLLIVGVAVLSIAAFVRG